MCFFDNHPVVRTIRECGGRTFTFAGGELGKSGTILDNISILVDGVVWICGLRAERVPANAKGKFEAPKLKATVIAALGNGTFACLKLNNEAKKQIAQKLQESLLRVLNS
ncbi:hypothetical protein A3K34_01375 [candidate division WWE3 bacterium RIFOXYC1_FULL_40_10]|uniref:Uncharacterized protein n=1 Tax=candidate division WWE3 bacterium RIFOXYA2_FULL_46_9 TaxID=1802636 RepID=A0A1F4W2H1_UNCKA|nr:MAG: hypothetical protein A3K58_01375 [candidate division WWE3 bacterium RIFOXYB1_FULL_40_22]OGC61521.1 MAG: hypothetical protein A3K37_01375 [candidate division WWE3 bacterium RIFOXYA1_FULL_40_11]OGC63570.1 MAG: hypothetical protein A2264_04315 [candidate division WWE3 bacterium RIFOXYA2_FULL_46_9]OGC64799.1 MAG: hypothetical protein A2326_02080 [candidate division WWE3 bacterium RIFOXYB2_FULL_41_6]OGC65904.1 MAG: hypothetical protein A3K34_01375 [candidate division WWE3 bacterium RIFOXYC1_